MKEVELTEEKPKTNKKKASKKLKSIAMRVNSALSFVDGVIDGAVKGAKIVTPFVLIMCTKAIVDAIVNSND